MELSSDVRKGLKLVADTAKIPNKYFAVLLENTISTLVESKHFETPQGRPTLLLFVNASSGRVRLD